MHRLTDLPADVDLETFSRWLNSQGVEHRVTEENGRQVLWLEDERLLRPVGLALQQYQQNPALQRAMRESPSEVRMRYSSHWQAHPKQAPFVFATLVVAALIAWFTGFGRQGPMQWLLFVDPTQWELGSMAARWDAWLATMGAGQWWRVLTPDLLHFSVSHLLFNGVMLWFLGSQIEVREKWGRFLGLLLVSSLTANLTQYLITGPLFGGLSGVVYGALGYVWLSQQFGRRFVMPPALMTVAMVWVVLGLTPLPEALGIGRMANGAHLGGLLGGLAYAMFFVKARR
ncbi:rhomboid family intramembrane serine protease [Marinobacteraceae bacterium S3BR75-40.1]